MNEKLKEVFEQAIPAYEKALEELPEVYSAAFRHCDKKEVDLGICWYAESELGLDIYGEVRALSGQLNFIFRPPRLCKTTKQIRESLQFRIDWMKNYLNEQP